VVDRTQSNLEKGEVYMQNVTKGVKMKLLKKLGFKSRKAKLMSRKKRVEEKRRIIIKTDPINLDQLHIKKEVDPN
jgi:hypothetical protein